MPKPPLARLPAPSIDLAVVQVPLDLLSSSVAPEATVTDLHRAALRNARDDATALTNLFTGRPARGLVNRIMREEGPMSELAPAFPTAGGALAPLKAKAEAAGRADFSSLWSGQAARLGREMGAGELTTRLADDALRRLRAVAAPA